MLDSQKLRVRTRATRAVAAPMPTGNGQGGSRLSHREGNIFEKSTRVQTKVWGKV